MTEEPMSLIVELVRQMRSELGDVRLDVSQVRADMATQSDLRTLRADVAADILVQRFQSSNHIDRLVTGPTELREPGPI